MLHLLQYYQNDFTFSPSLYSVALCDNIGLVLVILRLAMLFCHLSYCTMCIIHPAFTFYTIPISPLCNLKNFSFTCYNNIGTSKHQKKRAIETIILPVSKTYIQLHCSSACALTSTCVDIHHDMPCDPNLVSSAFYTILSKFSFTGII